MAYQKYLVLLRQLQECYQRQQTPAATAVLPALFSYFARWARGELPYEYQDGVLMWHYIKNDE